MKFEVRLASTFPTPANSMPVTVSSSPITAISAPFCSIPFFCQGTGQRQCKPDAWRLCVSVCGSWLTGEQWVSGVPCVAQGARARVRILLTEHSPCAAAPVVRQVRSGSDTANPLPR